MDSGSNISRFVLIGALLVLIGALGVGLVVSRQSPIDMEADEWRPTRVAPARRLDAVREQARQRLPDLSRERRREVPKLRPAEDLPPPEPEERPRAGASGSDGTATQPTAANAAPAGGGRPAKNDAPTMVDYSKSAIDRALVEVGIDAAKIADLQRRWGELAAEETQLRRDADHEEWLDSPEFAEELEAIASDRASIRNEIGDEAYDLFLFATGQQNRVYVTNVEQHSPAEVAGLRPGDIILRYDGVRIFANDDLLAEIDAATPGKPVRLDILRQGNPVEVEVVDGAPGVGFDVTQDAPARLR
jgi:integrase